MYRKGALKIRTFACISHLCVLKGQADICIYFFSGYEIVSITQKLQKEDTAMKS